MVVNMYIISPKKDQFKPVFFGLFDFSKIKRPRPRLQKTNKWSFSVLVLFGLSPVWLQSFASPRTGLSNTSFQKGSKEEVSLEVGECEKLGGGRHEDPKQVMASAFYGGESQIGENETNLLLPSSYRSGNGVGRAESHAGTRGLCQWD